MPYFPLYKVLDFFLWYFVAVPKRLFVILKRVVVLANYELALTLNIKLLFTPLFGDYTFVGRFIGFILRILILLFGAVALISLLFLLFLVPVFWVLLPVLIFIYVEWWALLVFAFVLTVKLMVDWEAPQKKVTQVGSGDVTGSFRPQVAKYIALLKSPNANGFNLFMEDSDILVLRKRLELLHPSFVEKFAGELRSHSVSEAGARAYAYAKKHETRCVEKEHLFLALLSLLPKSETLLATFSLTLETCEGAVVWVVSERERLSKVFFWQEDYVLPKMGGVNRGMTGRVTPLLDSVSSDFTEHARRGHFEKVIGKEKIIVEVAQLLGSSKVNVLLVGEPGCGKTSLVKGIASKIIAGVDFDSLKFKRIVSLEPGSLVAGTKGAGDLTEKLNKVLEEIKKSGDVILFIDEIHNLLINSSGEGSDVSAIFSVLEPSLSSGDLQFIGATNIENYRKYIEPNGAFSRLFQLVEVPEASPQDTLEILGIMALKYEVVNKIVISYPALVKTVELSKKLIHERVLPDKAVEVLNRAAAKESTDDRYLTVQDVTEVISDVTHVPAAAVTQEESAKLLNVESDMRKYVIGQDHAIDQLGRALKRARAGIRDETKPIASFLFVGTTGVGKTETAKTLAKVYFGDEKAMIRLDMSEYQQADSLNRLIGSPDGRLRGFLTDTVRSKPFSVILLDELEKAYSNVLLTFLQVLDDGRLTDTTGRVIDFTNTIIIATSNVGTRSIQQVAARGGMFDEMKEVAMHDVREQFAPEFLNRFTGVIVFRPLTMDAVRKITDLMLARVRRVAEQKGVKVTFSSQLVAELIKRGCNAEWGARPMARLIEETVESYLAVRILANQVKQGDTVELGTEVLYSQYDKQRL